MPYANPTLISSLGKINLIIHFLTLLIWLFLFSRGKRKKKELIPIIAFFVISFLSWRTSNNFKVFDVFFVPVLFSKFIDYKKIIKIYISTIILVSGIIILLYYRGFFPSYISTRDNGTIRTSLGYGHPNTLGFLALLLVILFYLYKNGKLNVVDYIIGYGASLWVYIYPNSITSSLLIFAFVTVLIIINLYQFLFKKNIIKSRFLQFISIIGIPILIFAIYNLTISNYGSRITDDLLSTFASRFLLAYRGVKTYGIHLLGNTSIEYVGSVSQYFSSSYSEYFVIDCFYMYMLVSFGIIPTIYYFYKMIDSIRVVINKKNTVLWISLIIIAVFQICESGLANILGASLYILAFCGTDNTKFAGEKNG